LKEVRQGKDMMSVALISKETQGTQTEIPLLLILYCGIWSQMCYIS